MKAQCVWARINYVDADITQRPEHILAVRLRKAEECSDGMVLELAIYVRGVVLEKEKPIDLKFSDDLGVNRHTAPRKGQRCVVGI